MKTAASVVSLLALPLGAFAASEPLDLDDIDLPRGFAIEAYAPVPNARSLAPGDNGVVYVSNRRASSIYALVPQGDANPIVLEIISGLDTPNGIAYYKGDLYVAEIDRILRYEKIHGHLDEMPPPYVLDIELPQETHHGWRYIGFGPDGKLYVAIGAPCNICDRDEEGFAQIWRMNPDGSGQEMFARGVRNSVGFTWHPETGELWFTDNNRDNIGVDLAPDEPNKHQKLTDDLPPGELNRAAEQGLHFGYPYCHGGDVSDPEFGEGKDCADYVAPAQELPAHVAALGVKFYTGRMFPEEYRGQIFLAEHGSWNRSKKIGYRISLVRLEDGSPVSYEVFADGFMRKDKVNGRPVDLLVLEDGSMLVSDDYGGMVYRIYYEE